jgi:ketosteroid isomerase-like protein
MARGQTNQEVFEHHVGALGAGDLDGIVEDYWDYATFITPDGVLTGKDGVRQGFTKLLADVPNAAWQLKTVIFASNALFLEWAATAATTKVEDGVDTFIFEDGQIVLQTVKYTVQHTS